MLWVKRTAAALLAVAVMLIAAAYLLPGEVSVTRTVEVAAPRATIFALVSDLRRFRAWSPWLVRDADTVITFTGPVEGVGQTIQWVSARRNIGSGRQTITGIVPGRAVTMELEFGDERPVNVWLNLEPGSGTTTVTWGMASGLGASPLARYLGLWVEGRVGPDLEAGLARLKALAEAG